jgi:translation initiation factor IF-3
MKSKEVVGPQKPRSEAAPLINERIRAEKVQLITHEGKNEGIVTKEYALSIAREAGLDLVVIASGQDGIPIAKIMDYGKAVYAKKKQLADAKKKQHVIQVKEVKLRPKIGAHDFQTKMNQALDFLREGKRVKFTLVFRGREIAMKGEQGGALFEKIQQALKESDVGSYLVQDKQEKESPLENVLHRIYYLRR